MTSFIMKSGVALFTEVPSPRAVVGIVLTVIAGVLAVRRREPDAGTVVGG